MINSALHTRRYDLDWLRVFAILLIFVYHCGRFFDYGWWHLKAEQHSVIAAAFSLFGEQWGLHLLFLLSGAGMYFSLQTHSTRDNVLGRVKRLLIPFLFGVFALAPPQVYFERLRNAEFHGSFLQFYPHYFDGLYFFRGNFSWMGHHLWFLPYLFLLSLAATPLFLYLKKEKGQRARTRLVVLSEMRGGIFLFALPFVAIQMSLRQLFPDHASLADFFLWLICLVLGYMIVAEPKLNAAIVHRGKLALALAILCSAIIVAWLLSPNAPAPSYSLPYLALMALRGFNLWFWLVAILWLGKKFLNFNHRVLKYGNEAVLPFYMLHQTIIIGIGYFALRQHWSVLATYLLIAASSFAAIMLVYELIVRRLNLMRWLFGMKRRNSSMSKTRLAILLIFLLPFSVLAQTSAAASPFELLWQFDTHG
ncbi:acyltransferase family protein [candidate division KSB1 bacterium]|nr:acyltransferase family protein [candidate division KSB1 bacterium]